MKKALACVFLLMGAFTTSRAQSSPFDYYRLTNAAELAICNKDLPAAAALYQKAFAINPGKAFTKDLLNAFYCAMDRKDYSIARQHLKRILGRGMSSDGTTFLQSQFRDADCDSLSRWLAVFPNDTLKSAPLLTSIKRMQETDLATRRHFSELHNGNYMVDSVISMDERNGRALAVLFREYGVPNEDLGSIGYNLNEGSSFQLLAVHHNGGYASTPKRASHELDTLLFNAIFTYDFHPQQFAQFLQRSEMSVSKAPFRHGDYSLSLPLAIPYIFVWEDSSVHPQYLAPELEASGNRERASIGLETFAELRQKLFFSKAEELAGSPYQKYALTGGIGIVLDAEDHKQADKYIAEFELYKPN